MKLKSDKLLHLIFMYFLTLLLGYMMIPTWVGGGMAFLVGFGKELSDTQIDWNDMLWNFIGIILALITLFLLGAWT